MIRARLVRRSIALTCLAAAFALSAAPVAGEAGGLVPRPTSPAANADEPRTALCLVCRVREGTMHHEPVRATRTWQGTRYSFCSTSCAEEFDRDPGRYAAAPDSVVAPRDSTRLPGVGAGIFGDAAAPRPSASTTPT
jgi:hypothetical protein